MKRFSGQLSAVLFLVGLGFALPPAAQGTPVQDTPVTSHVSDPSICIDGMETVPDSDDLEPTPAAADVGCTQAQGPVSI